MILDAVGVGAGPANLSFAALAAKCPELRLALIEQRPDVQWHQGILLSGARMQVSLFKDLVSLVDPTSRYSFVSFLHAQGRFLQFINASFDRVLRAEFDQYLRWIAEQLDCIEYGEAVREVSYDETFVVRTDRKAWRARSIVLGTGRVPCLPECCRRFDAATISHSAHYRSVSEVCAGKRVCVIGGGQSGAEIVLDLLSRSHARPAAVAWASRRNNFRPLEESCFTDEFYTTSFSHHFYRQRLEERESLIRELKLTSDGISSSLIREVYQSIYANRFLDRSPIAVELFPGCELRNVSRDGSAWQLLLGSRFMEPFSVTVDVVILATGYNYRAPSFLAPVMDRVIVEREAFVVNEDYSLAWRIPTKGKIYALNAALLQRGVADPNLSLLAWRSAVTLNSLAGRTVYPLADQDHLIDWMGPSRRCEERKLTA
jgi:lysine N6-hydroxylase